MELYHIHYKVSDQSQTYGLIVAQLVAKYSALYYIINTMVHKSQLWTQLSTKLFKPTSLQLVSLRLYFNVILHWYYKLSLFFRPCDQDVEFITSTTSGNAPQIQSLI